MLYYVRSSILQGGILMIYKTKGVCSQAIEVEVDGDTVKSVQFVGGCNGNTKGIAQ